MRPVILALLTAFITLSAQAAPPVYGYKVVATYPHSTSSYTEGLLYLNGRLLRRNRPQRPLRPPRRTTPATGQHPPARRSSPPMYFGEGIVDWGPYLYQWTWQIPPLLMSTTASPSSKLVRTLNYTGEGWGMTRTNTRPHHQRRLRDPTLPRSRHLRRDAATSPSTTASCRIDPPQRTRVHQGRNLRQRLAHRPHRPHQRPTDRPGPCLDRPHRPPSHDHHR